MCIFLDTKQDQRYFEFNNGMENKIHVSAKLEIKEKYTMGALIVQECPRKLAEKIMATLRLSRVKLDGKRD